MGKRRFLSDGLTNLIADLKSGDEAFYKKLYQQWRSEFIKWSIKNYKLNQEEASSLYQDTFVEFYLTLKKRDLLEIEHPKTFFYGIGKHLAMKRFRERKMLTLEDTLMDHDSGENVLDSTTDAERKTKVRLLLEDFWEPCRSILKMYYFNGFSHEVIAERLGYKNEGVMKKKKSLCMSELRKKWKSLKPDLFQ